MLFVNLNLKTFSYKFNKWKSYIVSKFVKIDKNINSQDEIRKVLQKYGEINLLVWSARQDYDLPVIPGLNVISVEDGLIRSVGLGAEYNIPVSLVFDSRGIYFDATCESDLEYILNNFELEKEEIIREARKLIHCLITNRVNKYNLNEPDWEPNRKCKNSKKIIIVPGQVEHDKSIQYGSYFVKDNITLLKYVRELNPDAYIVFKVHPDIYKNCRVNYTAKKQYQEYANEIVECVSTFSLIKYADEIHTITSLFGFEALLMKKRVFCYGHPFYSGWGLTEDLYPLKRRRKKISLEQLVYAVYFLYPAYVSLFNAKKIDVFETINEIIALRQKNKKIKTPLKFRLTNTLKNAGKKIFISLVGKRKCKMF